MKKITTLLLSAILCTGSLFAVNEPDTLVHWDFHQWAGGGATGVPANLTISTPIPGDFGLQATTVSIGTENMFEDGEGETVRPWGTPTAAGYVRASLMLPGTYYRIVGLTSTGYTTIKVKAGFAADSSSRYYYMQLQYRLGSIGDWVSVGDPAFINVVSETSIPVRFDDVELPEAANNADSLEIRFLVTALDGAATTTQSRMDNVIITAIPAPVEERERTSLAEWTFDWLTPEVALTTDRNAAIAPDRGTLISTALFATENLATTTRRFSFPSTTGYYVYATNWHSLEPEKYWWITGLNTEGSTDIHLSSKHSNQTAYSSAFKIQYRIGGETGTWTDIYGPFESTSIVTLNNPAAVADGPTPENPVVLPAACEEQTELEIRYLLTTATSASGGQVRIDAIILSAMKLPDVSVGVENENENLVKFFSSNNKLYIRGAAGLSATIYTLTGAKVKTVKALTSDHEIELSGSGIYIVNVNGRAFKVII